MEYSIDIVANKMVLVISGLSVIIALIGYFILASMAGNADASLLARTLMGVNLRQEVRAADAIPFAVGVGMAMGLNIAKVILLKRAVNNSLKREANEAKFYLKGQYFLRLVLTIAVFVIVGLFHSSDPQHINAMGTVYAIFTFPIAVYSMRFFMRDALKDEILEGKIDSGNAVKSAIEELKAIGAGEESADE